MAGDEAPEVVEPGSAPVLVVAARDGSGCRELVVVDDARHLRHAVRRLAVMAKVLRVRGGLGVLVLTEAATARVVATRGIWP